MRRAGGRPLPCRRGRTLNTPSGRPASASHSATSSDADGSRSDGLSTKVLPQAIAIGHIHIGHHRGEVERRDPGADAQRLAQRVHVGVGRHLLGVRALEQMRDAARELDDLETAGDLTERVGDHLAVLGADDPREIVLVALGRARGRRTSPAPVARAGSRATRRTPRDAASTAASTSAGLASGTSGRDLPRGRVEDVARPRRSCPATPCRPPSGRRLRMSIRLRPAPAPLRLAITRVPSPLFTCDEGEMHVRGRGVHIVRLLVGIAAVGLIVGARRSGRAPAPRASSRSPRACRHRGSGTATRRRSSTAASSTSLPRTSRRTLGYSGVKYSNVSFDALVAGKAKGFDLALSQVTITKDRAKVVGFTVPVLLGRPGDPRQGGDDGRPSRTSRTSSGVCRRRPPRRRT